LLELLTLLYCTVLDPERGD